jgi:hypothetical protein
MSDRNKLEQRVRTLEEELEELKAQFATPPGGRKVGPAVSAQMYREEPQCPREAEREYC